MFVFTKEKSVVTRKSQFINTDLDANKENECKHTLLTFVFPADKYFLYHLKKSQLFKHQNYLS